ncbi:MAG TPA: AAA family ATPase [Nitrososphaerales archaeon]|nr:AAA family ATPase [Nitrososphaerales archaeon]
MWSEKYRPKAIDRLIGNEESRLVLSAWLSKWKPGAKAALLMGPPGTGKTTFVNLLAKENGMNLVDLNASDVRTKDMLRKRMGEVMGTVSLFGERSLIFLDEVDGLAGRADYGAVEFIKESVKESQNPIVMAANDPDSDEIKKLSSSCLAVRFRPPPPREVEMYLREVARGEGLAVGEEELRRYVRESAGDVRQAINLLQGSQQRSQGGDGDSRGRYKDTDRTVSEAFNGFFGAADKEEALASLRAVSMSPFEKVREMHRSVVKSGLPAPELARALQTVSSADLLIGRMMKSGEWRMLRYLDRLFVEGLFPLVKGRGVKYTGQDDLPFPVLVRVWNDSKKIREISVKYAAKAHTSGMSARSQDLPYVFALCSKKQFREGMERALGLDADPDVLESYDKFLQKEAAR